MAHKCQGMESGHNDDKDVCEANDKSPRDIIHGQCHWCVPGKQKVQHEFKSSVENNDRITAI